MAINLEKLRAVAQCQSTQTALTLSPRIDGSYDLVGTCVACGTDKVVVDKIKPETLLGIKATRDSLADCINALAALTMNCNLPEKQREAISRVVNSADRILDQIDGLGNA